MAEVIIKDLVPRVQWVGDGVTAAFDFPFVVFAATDVQVYLDDAAQSSGYAVSGIEQTAGGTVTFDAPPEAGVVITLARAVTIERLSDYQVAGAFRARDVNRDLDRLMAIAQDLRQGLERAIVVPVTSTLDPRLLYQEALSARTRAVEAQEVAIAAQATAEAAAASAVAAQAASAASEAAVAQWVETYVGGSGFLAAANNLSDLHDVAEARTALGLADVAASGAYQDLSGLPELGEAAALSRADIATLIASTDVVARFSAVASGSALVVPVVAGAKEISIAFNGLTVSSSTHIVVQLVTESGAMVSGYTVRAACHGVGNSAPGFEISVSGAGWPVGYSGAYTAPLYGELRLLAVGGGAFVGSGSLSYSGSGGLLTVATAGRGVAGGEVSAIRITTLSGSATFSAGSVATFSVL